ncbi:hypothetical protein FACS1894184_07470 [Clostridia bacterium]|nr:hypothetical protein FACS1894184_07470 [Clostridia bacterium]
MNALGSVKGVVAYEHSSTRDGLILITTIMVVILAAMFIIPLFVTGSFSEMSGLSDGGIFPVFMIVTMLRAARKDTTFLITRPISRRGVWLGLMAHLVIVTVLLAALRAALMLAWYVIMLPLSRSHPQIYRFATESPIGGTLFTPSQAPLTFWRGFKDIVSAGLFAYCYGCLLERWKGWTIGLSLGLPALGFVIFVLPIVYAFINDINVVIDGGQTGVITSMPLLVKWIEIIQVIADWVEKYFEWLFWSAAAASVPIGYLTMRTSRHTA